MEKLPHYDEWKTRAPELSDTDRERNAEVYIAKAYRAWGASVASDLEEICKEYESMTDGVDLVPISSALYELKTFFSLNEMTLGMRHVEMEYAEDALIEAKGGLNVAVKYNYEMDSLTRGHVVNAMVQISGALGWLRHSRRRTG